MTYVLVFVHKYRQGTMAESQDILPISSWGLDPLFSTNVRLFVQQVHALQEIPGAPEVYLLGTHPVMRVSVLGVVVLADRRSNRTSYKIDDGSGLLTCTQWHSSADGPAAFALGDTVTYQGRLSTFRGQRELTIASSSRVDSVTAELLWWLDVCRLTRDVYSRPAREFIDAARRRRALQPRSRTDPPVQQQAPYPALG
jgi:hypothetical protein